MKPLSDLKFTTTFASLASVLVLANCTPAVAQTGLLRGPLVVAPVIEGLQMCDEAAQDQRFTNVYEAEAQCSAEV